MRKHFRIYSKEDNIQTWFALLTLALVVSVGKIIYKDTGDTPFETPSLIVDKENGINNNRNTVYQNGVFSAEGDYLSPGGSEKIIVSLTLTNDVVTDAQVTPLAELPTSKAYQNDFIQHYKQFVIGQNIDTLELDKISGSSLTPKGFNDALKKIKEESRI